jgi:hypothetical protein
VRRVELVEVADQRLIRFGVTSPGRLGVTDADAEQEAAWMPGFDAVVRRRYRFLLNALLGRDPRCRVARNRIPMLRGRTSRSRGREYEK